MGLKYSLCTVSQSHCVTLTLSADPNPKLRTQWDCCTLRMGHIGTGTLWGWDTMGLVHSGNGTQWDWYTLRIGHNGTGTLWERDTMALVHSVNGTHSDWCTLKTGHNRNGTL